MCVCIWRGGRTEHTNGLGSLVTVSISDFRKMLRNNYSHNKFKQLLYTFMWTYFVYNYSIASSIPNLIDFNPMPLCPALSLLLLLISLVSPHVILKLHITRLIKRVPSTHSFRTWIEAPASQFLGQWSISVFCQCTLKSALLGATKCFNGCHMNSPWLNIQFSHPHFQNEDEHLLSLIYYNTLFITMMLQSANSNTVSYNYTYKASQH
jgi:hypothetical protein